MKAMFNHQTINTVILPAYENSMLGSLCLETIADKRQYFSGKDWNIHNKRLKD